ncbi:MAG: nitroreductase family protein [Bacteroidales bacterium]|nr:nitroreductase family protein [Bacteroidales bacterium]
MSKFWDKISDITHLHKRANFSDLPDRLPVKESTFMTIAKERYSCRKFKDTPLTEAQINHILEAARIAPSACNFQPVHVWVVKSPEALEKLKGATDYTYGAPAVFVVGCKADKAWVRKYDGKNGAEIDAAIVGTHIMLEASALGLGNVWVGSFDPAKIKADFPEMEGYEPVCLFPVGVPATEAGPNHAKRQSKEEFSSEL